MSQAIRWVVSIGVMSALCFFAALAVGRTEEPFQRTFEFTYAARIAGLPSGGKQARVWVPLAKTRRDQTIRARHVRADVPYRITEEAVYGNDMLYVDVSAPFPASLDIAVDYDVVVTGGDALAHPRAAGRTSSPEELRLNLRDEPLMVVNDAVRRLAIDATQGRAGEVEKARALYDYVIAHMRYDKTTPGWGRGDTLRACELGRGNCTDFHSLFISMARSIGIPAQFVIGAPVPKGESGEITGYHCWAEFYSPSHGWVPVDASEAWKHPHRRNDYFGAHDPNRLLISAGRNLQLVPAQAGPPVNIFVTPYVEVDGVSVSAADTRFQFRSHHGKGAAT